MSLAILSSSYEVDMCRLILAVGKRYEPSAINQSFLGGDTSQADVHLKHRSRQFHYVPLANSKTTTHIANQNLQALFKTAFGHSRWPFSPVAMAAYQAIQNMALVFHEAGPSF
jgi:hypothetical protein